MLSNNKIKHAVNNALFFSFLFFLFVNCSDRSKPLEKIAPPKIDKIKKELTIHGDTRIDNYYWLNERENPKVIKYLEDENAYLEKALKHT